MSYTADIIKAANEPLQWERLKGCNILVLGATGLIGATLIDVLMHRQIIDFNVYASGRNTARASRLFEEYASNPCFHFITHDVTHPFNINIHFDYIIYAASGASPILYSTKPVEVMKSNLEGVINIMDSIKVHPPKKFVYISSGDIYGEGLGRPFKENDNGYVDPLDIRSCYTSSKRATETLCISYSHEYNINVCIARPSHTYGPRFTESDTRVYAQFIRNVISGEDIIMKSDGSQVRSWCYVVNCALGILYIMLYGENREAYNITDKDSVISIKELADIIAVSANRKVRFELPDNIESAGYNRVSVSTFDTSKLEKLGWHSHGKIEFNLKHSIDYVKNSL